MESLLRDFQREWVDRRLQEISHEELVSSFARIYSAMEVLLFMSKPENADVVSRVNTSHVP